MPGGDRTGPMGFGPGTGRGAGLCSGDPVPGYLNPIPGRGFGWGFGHCRGFGGGMGWGRRTRLGWTPWHWQATPQDERNFLENQMQVLKDQLGMIKQRLDELGAQEKMQDKTENE